MLAGAAGARAAAVAGVAGRGTLSRTGFRRASVRPARLRQPGIGHGGRRHPALAGAGRSSGSATAASPGPAPRSCPGAGIHRRCHSRRPPGRAHQGRSCPGRKDQRCQGRRVARKDPRHRLVPHPHRPARGRHPRSGAARARRHPAVRAAGRGVLGLGRRGSRTAAAGRAPAAAGPGQARGREPHPSLPLRCGPGHDQPSWFPLSSHRYRRMTCRQGTGWAHPPRSLSYLARRSPARLRQSGETSCERS